MERSVADLFNWHTKTFNSEQIFSGLREISRKKTDEDVNLSPSKYLKEILLTTEERFEDLIKPGRKQEFTSIIGESKCKSFKSLPAVIIFQQYAPGNAYSVLFTVRNVTEIPHYLRLSCDSNPSFTIEFRGQTHSTMVAPGLAHVYNVQFIPEEKRDYQYLIKFATDTDDLIVPVIALGPRPILDFPDHIEVPTTGTKISSTKPIYVRNIGNAPAAFTLFTDNKCFQINPTTGIIDPEEAVQFTVNFFHHKPGDFYGKLFLKYETGETLQMNLHCTTTDCTIRLDRGSIKMESTYLGMSRSKTLAIHNRSDYVVKFKWVKYRDREADEKRKEEFEKLFDDVRALEASRCGNLVHFGICTPDVHELVYDRIYTDEVAYLQSIHFPYNHACFSLIPEEGEIWPQACVNVTAIFQAKEVGETSSIAYLEVTGREDRIPLNLNGVGKGPLIVLNVLTIDVQNIYLCSVHNCQVVAANKGYITGVLAYRPKRADFGGTIKVSPSTLELVPDECKAFNLSFSSNRKGDFIERIDFVIKESNEVLSLHIKGCIICPTLHFDKESLDFGIIPLGFSARQDVCLHNLSMMPVTFSITVLENGIQPALTYEEFAKAQVKPSFPSSPREFLVSPCEGVVAAHSFLRIKITYTANIACTSSSTMKVDMWDSDSDPVTLPIKFGGCVASLIVNPAEITIKFCFINFPYTRNITVENTTDLDGYFYLVPQPVSESAAIMYSMSTNQGLIKAHQSKTITVTIITKVLGVQNTTLRMLTMGDKQPVTCCTIMCTGQGPVVSAQPTGLDFGECTVLEEKTMLFSIISDSPIPATFTILMGKRNSPWDVHPDIGELQPNSTIPITVKLYLQDVGKYSDQIIVNVFNSRPLNVSLTCIGVGCSVIFEPEIFPCFDMGLLFSHQKISIPIKMTNMGTRHHQISFSNMLDSRTQKEKIAAVTNAKFQVVPLVADISPGQTNLVYCKIRWDVNETVLEDWYVFAQITGSGKREMIGTSTFKVTFTEPQVVFSKKELIFRIDRTPYGDHLQQTDELSVTNKSKLDLNVQLSVGRPFHLINEEEELFDKIRFVLYDEVPVKVRVKFIPKRSGDNLYSHSYRQNLWFDCGEHPHRERIKCIGSINFPNLHFSTKDVHVSCELGSSAEKIVTMANHGPVAVLYKLLWIGESIEIERMPPESAVCGSSDPGLNFSSERLKGMCENDSPAAQQLIPPTNTPASEEVRIQKLKLEDSPTTNGRSTCDAQTTNDTTQIKVHEVSQDNVRSVLLPMIEKYFVEDTEIPALESIGLKPVESEEINDFLYAVPCEGTVLPYSSQYLHFAFHGLERMKIKGSLQCEIVRGATETFQVQAVCDKIRYFVDKLVIDYGQQLFCESCRSCFTLKNDCAIGFLFKVDESNFVHKSSGDRVQSHQLVINPSEAFVDAMASTEVEIHYQPMRLGPFDVEFQLEVGHLMPLPMRVIGVGTFPQVYLCLPRNNIFEEYPTEIGYRAIQALSMEFIPDKPIDGSQSIVSQIGSIETIEEFILTSNEWEIITANDVVPDIMDIEMAIERTLAAQFISENSYILLEHDMAPTKRAIPHLLCPEYVIDMQYLLIGVVSHCSVTLTNYGPWKADVELKRIGGKTELARAGVSVQFRRERNLAIGAKSTLHVTCHPTQARYTEKWAELREKFYLQVTHGFSIPVIVKGIVTYPRVTTNAKRLDFQEVLVGECLMMCLLIENDGLIDCHWEARLYNGRKRYETDGPFYLHRESDIYAPGQSGVLNVYFKPRKSGVVSAKLNITSRMGLEKLTVTLEGRGTEHKLRVAPSVITFAPVVPFTTIQEQVLTVENICQYPVEFFWHHLDSQFQEEDRLANVLTRYYQVAEILLPPRKLGEGMPMELAEFYRNLTNEMACALPPDTFGESESLYTNEEGHRTSLVSDAIGEDRVPAETGKKRGKSSATRNMPVTEKSPVRKRRSARRRSTVRATMKNRCSSVSGAFHDVDRTRKPCPPMLITDSLDFPREAPPLLTDDSEEIQNLLYCYIEKLQKKENFQQKMKDPVRDVFNKVESEQNAPENHLESVKPAKRACIIFHGAPFTEYQEVACKSAKTLGVNLLCLDKAIIEGIAFGETPTSAKLRQMIDDSYLDHLSRSEKYRTITSDPKTGKLEDIDENAESPRKSLLHSQRSGRKQQSFAVTKEQKSPNTPKSVRSSRKHRKDSGQGSPKKQEAEQLPNILRLRTESDALNDFNKIPDAEKLELMDPLTRYEYKIEAIRLLQRILTANVIGAATPAKDRLSTKSSEKSDRKKSDDHFLGMDSASLKELLRQRLASSEFEKGFVLQSLKNMFIPSEVSTLLALLEIVGYVEYYLFVTFLNSPHCYERKAAKLRDIERTRMEEDGVRKILDIEEMSLSEYEQLPEEDKRAYMAATLPAKRSKALQRQIEFSERRQVVLRKRKAHRQSLQLKSLKPKKMQKQSKSKLTVAGSRDEKSMTSRPTSSKKETGRKKAKSRESSRPRKEKVSKEMEEITTVMEYYYSNLTALEEVLKNWDPVRKHLNVHHGGKPKIPRTAKSRMSVDTSRELWDGDLFHIWYVKASDPWDSKIYDTIMIQMYKNDTARAAIPVERIIMPDLSPQLYSVLCARNISKGIEENNDVFQLINIVPSEDAWTVVSQSIEESVITNNSQVPTEIVGTQKKKRRRKSSSKPDDMKTLISTSESKGTTLKKNVGVSLDEGPKPRSILQPHEIQKFKIRYHPHDVGVHTQTYTLSIVNGSCISYSIKVEGIADIPRLDMNPNVVFSKVANEKPDAIDEPIYLLDSETFDFGSLLVPRKDKRAHHRSSELKFHNISKIDADVQFYTMENNPDVFLIEPDKLFIPPDNYRTLKLTAGATKMGPIVDRLYIRIQNNPQVETIELRSHGSKLDLEIDGKYVSFDRVLLYRRESRATTIKNKSGVSIFWTVEAEGDVDSQISFLPAAGTISPKAEQKIEFCYHAQNIGVVEGSSYVMKVYLHEVDEEPILTDIIVATGETYDVAVDIDHANPIDLKSGKVDLPVSAYFTMRNRGLYEIKYVLTLRRNDKSIQTVAGKPVNLKTDLDFSPTAGALMPQKLVTVQVTFVPRTEITLKDCPLLLCQLVDTQKQDTVVAEIPLTISLAAYYTRFRLFPDSHINFGTVSIYTHSSMYLNMENIGQFPFNYSIEPTPDRHPSIIYMTQIRREDSTRKKDDKKDKKSGRTDNASSSTVLGGGGSLRVGPFSMSKIEGEVAPGQIETLAIDCYPEFVGSQEETILLAIADSVPDGGNRTRLKLSVNSCVPSIDFHDLDAIFHENHVVDDIQDFVCPNEIGSHTVFARPDKRLYFRRVCVLSSHATCFKLYNRNMIPADVEVLLQLETLMPKNAKPDTFAVEPQKERIPPMSYKRFTVSFAPTLIQTYHCNLEAFVNLPAHLGDDKLRIKLQGEACVPEVDIVEPPRAKRERSVVNFSRVLVGETNVMQFAFKNIGFVLARVIVEIHEDPALLFSFSPHPETEQFLRVRDYDPSYWNNRCSVVRLMPQETARFKANFHPKETGKSRGQIRLFIVDNPYENLTIDLEGEGYVETVILEGLDLMDTKTNIVGQSRESGHKTSKRTSSKNRTSLSSVSTSQLAPALTYVLDYGSCFISKMYRRVFKIVNKSASRCFRFEWSAHPDLVFSPTIGHLRYRASKEITATFLAAEPTKHADTRLECVVYEIEVPDPMGEVSWDDRQTEVRWEEIDSDAAAIERSENCETPARKVIQVSAEPDHRTVPGTARTMQLFLTAVVAYSSYSCPVQEINFRDTLMFQKREYNFPLSNPGTVTLTFAWKLNMDEQYPIRAAHLSPLGRSRGKIESRPSSRSSGGVLYPVDDATPLSDRSRRRSDGDDDRLRLHRCKPFSTYERTSPIKPEPCSYRHSDLFSSTACLTERSTDSWVEGDDLPFEIHPQVGSLQPGGSIDCTLKFAPMDVFEYKAYLTCKVENLDPSLQELVIPITARSVLPYCHFDVPESDYVSSGRRDPRLPGPTGYKAGVGLPENTRVIEFNVMGVGETHVKRFDMINPTGEDFHFSWEDRTFHPGDEVANFHCAVPEGTIERGKRIELSFTFLAEHVGTFESFWLFSIGKYNLECLFLFVAIVTEPSVHCLTVHQKMKPTILGISVSETVGIYNNEDFEIPYKVLQESLYSEGRFQELSVSPMCGVLLPRSEQVLWIEYRPSLVGEFQFSVQCLVKMMKKPLTIFITTTAFNIIPSISCTDLNNEIITIHEGQENIIDFGKVMLRQPATIKFDIRNLGKMTFYYTWDLGMTPEILSRNSFTLTMPQRQGHVLSNSQDSCHLTLTALQKTMIKNHSVTVKITRGPTYRLTLKARATKPTVQFSFTHYDFGLCYVEELGTQFYTVDLVVKNCEPMPSILESKFEDQPHLCINLDPISEAIAPDSSVSIPIKFRPLDKIKYHDSVVFLINTVIERKVTVKGEGIPYNMPLANPRDKSISLGDQPVGKLVTKRVPILNEGRAPVTFRVDLIEDLPNFHTHQQQRAKRCSLTDEPSETHQERASVSETKRSNTIDLALQTGEPDLSDILTILPSEQVTLQPGKKMDVVVQFLSRTRIRAFTTKVGLQTNQTILPLFVLRGSCVGAKFNLNRTYLPFGIVVEGCTSEAKVVLTNTGDIGARFKWNTSKLLPVFKLHPISGYCSPGMDVNFVVSFHPTVEISSLEGEAVLEIEQYTPITLRITGGCCKLPEPIATLLFTTSVRTKQTKSINIFNDTLALWKLKPEASGEFFAGAETLTVPAKSSSPYQIVYAPFIMNDEHSPHKGTLLIQLPESKTPLLYSLQGQSSKPEPLDNIVRQFPAKTKYTELLAVYNWTSRQEKFTCTIERTDKPKQANPIFSFTGNAKIDVPANSQRDYRAVFHTYGRSNYHFKITFANPDGEYQFYNINYDVTEPEVIESIKLTTSVRVPVCHTIQLNNPLEDQFVRYTAEYNNPYIVLRQMPIHVQPLSSEFVTIKFCPLLTCEESLEKLMVFCPELGYFPYNLWLKAEPAPPEKPTRVSAVLGRATTFSVNLKNLVQTRTTFLLKVDNESFTCPKSVDLRGKSEEQVDVIYEPSDIENITANLTAVSTVAGDYVFPIIGSYCLPKPQGPYTVTIDVPVTIPFKNVFKETKTFELVTDVPEVFNVVSILKNIKSKQIVNINVSLKHTSGRDNAVSDNQYPVTGKLSVNSTDTKISHILWIYYLRGVAQ